MPSGDPSQPIRESEKREHAATAAAAVVIAIAACLMLAGCAQGVGEAGSDMFGFSGVADLAEAAPQDPQKAVEFWGKAYTENPRDLDKALSYAQSLKATGQKTQAIAILQQASMLHGNDRRLASDYGRLALELDQVSTAKKLLEAADDPANPDWRVIMARGTVLAKEAKYAEAIPFYERALVLSPEHPSVMNNLALAYTMNGDVTKAEALLRRAAEANGANAKVRQNLALVLGLQGKYDEATQVGAAGVPPDVAQANTDLLRKIVKLEPKSEPSSTWTTEATPEAKVAAVWNADILDGGDGGAPAAAPAAPLSDSDSDSDSAVSPAPTAVSTPAVAPTPAVATGTGLLGHWPDISSGGHTGEVNPAALQVH
jgi:Flp pilus assembly protein TadD